MPCRRTADKTWSVASYGAAVEKALASAGRPGTLEMVFGPWIPLGKAMSAFALMRNVPLLDAFLDGGQRAGVLHGARLEAATKTLLQSRSHLVCATDNVAATAHHFTNHCMAIMRVLRLLKQEEGDAETGNCRSGLYVRPHFSSRVL